MNSTIDPLVWEQAARWCECRDELDDTLHAERQQWLDADEQHRRAYEFVCTQIDSDELEMALAQVPRPSLPSPLPELATHQGQTAAANDDHGSAAARRTTWGIGIAAMALLAVAVIWRLAPGEGAPTTMALQEVATPRGGSLELQTADGSRLRLNADTRLTYNMHGRERRVELRQGEVYFDVAHDDHKPFVIAAGDTRVEVLGTAFDVNRINGRVHVTVFRGQVRVSASDNVLLGVGDSVWVDGHTLGAISHADAGGEQADWMQGWLEVSNQPLVDVVAQLQRYLPQTVVLSDVTAGQQRVSGRFPLTQPRQSLALLGQLGGLQLKQKNDQLVLAR